MSGQEVYVPPTEKDFFDVLDAMVSTQFSAVAPAELRMRAVPFVEAAIGYARIKDSRNNRSLSAARRTIAKHLPACREAVAVVRSMRDAGKLPKLEPWPAVSDWPDVLRKSSDRILSALRGTDPTAPDPKVAGGVTPHELVGTTIDTTGTGTSGTDTTTCNTTSVNNGTMTEPNVGPAAYDLARSVVRLPLSTIRVPTARRASLSEPTVQMLIQSIARVGLMSPIRVAPATDGSGYDLVAGLHRLVTHERLERPEIDAVVVTGDPVEVELDEVEENLARKDLSLLERAVLEHRQKELYLQRHPETKQGSAGALRRHGVQATHVSFAESRAESGSGKRMVERRLQIGRSLSRDVVGLIAGSPIADNFTQLLRLARLPEDVRRPVAEVIATGKTTTVDAAFRIVAGTAAIPKVPRDQEARAPLVQTSGGYAATVFLMGREVVVHVAGDLSCVDLADHGPGQAPPSYEGDGLPLEPTALTTVLRETVAELPADLARDFAVDEKSVSPNYVTVDLRVRNRSGKLGVGRPESVRVEIWWSVQGDSTPAGEIIWAPMTARDHLRTVVRGRPARGAMRQAFRKFLAHDVLRHTHAVTRPVRLAASSPEFATPVTSTDGAPLRVEAEVDVRDKLISALINLGFKRKEATFAAGNLDSLLATEPLESLVRRALATLRP